MDYKTQIIENAKNIAKILSDALKIKELPESTQGIKSDDSIALQRGDETLQAKISELPFASITDIYGLTALIKGGYYNILGTYNYFVWVQEYIINGTYTNFYRSNTLPVETSDLTFDRFDTIIINTAGLLFIRKGVASANPIEPEVDNLTELKIALIFVEANSVAPVGVTEVVVFDEGGGTASGEFDITHAGSVLSAEQSSSGANSLKLVNKSAAFAISTLNYNGSELSNITMKVFLATSTKNALRFSLWNVDDMRVGEVYVNHNDYGFNAYLIGVWQTLSIPSTGFRTADWAALQYNTLWINNNKSGSTVYIDDIKIQQGLSQPTNSNITHTHSNFSLLESITQTLVNSWNAAYNWVNTNGANVLENLANKQNSLATDGTGAKYPTVDAVNAGLDGKVDDAQVLTNVPAGALFTDTIYNDADVLKDADALTAVSPTNKLITQTDVAALIDDVAPTVVNGGFWIEPDTAKLSVGVNNAWVEVGRDGIDGADGAAGVGDMVLANTQTVSGLKTFLNGTFGLRNIANTFTALFSNINTAIRTYTFPDKDGTVAMTSDITGINSGTNTGDQTIPTTLPPTDGSVTRAKLDAEQKSRIVLSTDNIDWSLGKEFTKTLTANWTITETNLPTGTDTDCIIIYVTGAFTITPPAYWKKHGTGAYDGTKVNMYVIDCLNGTSASEDVKYAIIPAV